MKSNALLLSGLISSLFISNLALGQTKKAVCRPYERVSIEVVGKMERSERNFTQGFEFHNGAFFESTGAYGGSTRLNLLQKSGSQQVLSESIQAGTFGEGLTVLSRRIFQATWKDKRMFVFDLDGSHILTMNLPFIGWGLTNDGSNLILTDGTPTMRFLTPSDLSVVREVQIRAQHGDQGQNVLVSNVNELEWIKGKIFGNIYQTNIVVRVEPTTGCVDGIIDATELISHLPEAEREYLQSDANFVLNGIAYDGSKDEIYLTGKNWKYVFKIKIK